MIFSLIYRAAGSSVPEPAKYNMLAREASARVLPCKTHVGVLCLFLLTVAKIKFIYSVKIKDFFLICKEYLVRSLNRLSFEVRKHVNCLKG